MTGEWKECKLGGVVSSNKESIGKSYPFQTILYLDTGSITRGKIDSFQEYELSNAPSRAKRLVKNNDIVYSTVRPIQRHYGFIVNPQENLVVSTGFAVIEAKEHLSEPLFIYYFLTSDEIVETLDVIAEASTSAYPSLKPSDIETLDIFLPPLPEQRAIASVLSSLDDKIDLLHRQNKTLEDMAETLFRQWFVEEADEEWEERNVTELFEIRDGTHDSPKQKEIGKALLTSKHILKDRLDIENAYLISNEDFGNINRRSKVDTNDILFSMIGTIGLIYLEQSSEINYAIKNIGLFKTSQNPEWAYYTFLWLKSSLGQDFIHEHRSGSTQEYISLGSLRSIVFRCPPTKLHREFNEIINLYFNKIKFNNKQIRTLEKLRDTLLPKLMSGEVRVEFAQGDQPDE
ncbi:restriction endonuclease subunit S [Methanosarcina mazei]|uniref:Type I restriction modification DNA specificity domain-containing protein n=1 Tax=Methanosarcina mazei TaxID=2209 RepID=A0A6C0VKM7_METMZ|nr:restriction endonuclease subunit S [Methanosarcina mazei]QIB91705.1 hypothetical protein FQU78_12265 [Methanosarcina mazei]